MKDYGIDGERVGDLIFPKGILKISLDNRHKFYSLGQLLNTAFAIAKEEYVPEVHDCDDFALDAIVKIRGELPGAPVGIATGRNAAGQPHAVAVFMVKETIPINGEMQQGIKRYYYDATARKLLTSFDVDYMMV